jgi:hypothetical protein
MHLFVSRYGWKCEGSTAEDVKKQVLEQKRQSGTFAVQWNKGTDVSNAAQLMVCVGLESQ